MENPFEIIVEKLNRIEALLQSKSKIEDNSVTEALDKVNKILNTDEAAKHLSLAKPTLYALTSQREIPHFKTGKKLYFKLSELDQWLTKHRVKTNDEIDMMPTEYILPTPPKVRRRY